MKASTNSVLRLNAKFKKHLQIGIIPGAGDCGIRSKLEELKIQLGRWYYVFSLMQVSGCRINEILKADHGQISQEGGLHIKASKRSRDRYVYAFECSQYLLKMKYSECAPFHHMNIFAAIRLMKSYHLYTQKKGRKNMTITGIFRNEKAKNVRDSSKDESLTASVLGHKSEKSTSFYGKD